MGHYPSQCFPKILQIIWNEMCVQNISRISGKEDETSRLHSSNNQQTTNLLVVGELSSKKFVNHGRNHHLVAMHTCPDLLV